MLPLLMLPLDGWWYACAHDTLTRLLSERTVWNALAADPRTTPSDGDMESLDVPCHASGLPLTYRYVLMPATGMLPPASLLHQMCHTHT
jgi:hypothetical protein